jgi:hypothetical protein
MQETPNPTWPARLIVVLSVLVVTSSIALHSHYIWFHYINNKRLAYIDGEAIAPSLGIPAGVALLSWAFYYTAIGNTRLQDSTVLRKAGLIYIAYFLLYFPTIALWNHFIRP